MTDIWSGWTVNATVPTTPPWYAPRHKPPATLTTGPTRPCSWNLPNPATGSTPNRISATPSGGGRHDYRQRLPVIDCWCRAVRGRVGCSSVADFPRPSLLGSARHPPFPAPKRPREWENRQVTQPATNAQVALQCAAHLRAGVSLGVSRNDVELLADSFLRWLDANTPPPADQPEELA